MAVTKNTTMPITVPPYDHQQKAFEFVLRTFGVWDKGGDDIAQDCKIHGFGKKKEGDANASNQ